MITVTTLRAAGLTEAQIAKVVEVEWRQRIEQRRKANRLRQQARRTNVVDKRDVTLESVTEKKPNKNKARHARKRDTPVTPVTLQSVTPPEKPNQINACHATERDNDVLLLTSLPSSLSSCIDRPLPTAARAKRRPLPDDWQPKGDQRDPTEADEFRDHARAKGYQYIDWDAAYRNFQKSPYNARNKGGQSGQGRRSGSVLDAFDRLGERLKAAGASDDYVPGSSGPRPLELDTQVRPAGLKLVPKG